MGNAPTCVDCSRTVPSTIRLFDIFPSQFIKRKGREAYRYFTGEKWTKTGDNDYICPLCIKKREQRGAELKEEENKVRQNEKENERQEEKHVTIEKEMQKLDEYRKTCDRNQFSRINKEKQEVYEIKEAKGIKREVHDLPLSSSVSSSSEEVIGQHEESLNTTRGSDTDATVTKSLHNIHERLKWETDELDKVVANPFFRDNPQELVKALRLLEIYAINPDDIMYLEDSSFSSKFKIVTVIPSEVMKVIDYLSKESTNIEKTLRKNFSGKNPRKIDFIIQEMTTVLPSEDLSRIQRIIKRYNERVASVRMGHIATLRTIYGIRRVHSEGILENEGDICENIFLISKAVKKTKDFWPNDVQIFALLCLIRSYKNGVLLQIKTGEGKSCIVAMFAAFLCRSRLQTYVDIVSSSSVLACRDSIEWKPFYRLLRITVTHNITKNDSSARQECYSKNVVYGSVSTFASDILREEFLLEKIRSGRNFEIVIVDEVDSLVLDNGVQFTYLSHAVPGLHHLEPVLLMIWNEVVTHTFIQSTNSDRYAFGKCEPIHEILLSCIDISDNDMQDQLIEFLQIFVENGFFGQCISEKILTEIIQGPAKFNKETSIFRQTFDSETVLKCLECLRKYGIEFKLFSIDKNTTQLDPLNICFSNSEKASNILIRDDGWLSFLYDSKRELPQLIEKKILSYLESENQCEKYDIPQNLMPFLKNRLNEWIHNAFIAKSMQPGREYLVIEHEIVPIDFESTGVIEHGTKWGDCLHQFLEIKHAKQLSQISVVTNFLSNYAFLKKYEGRIFGLSGTLGTEEEKKFLFRSYNLKCLKIPTSERQKFYEVPGLLCQNTEEWISNIHERLLSMKQRGRPVLVICEDINKTELVNMSLPESKFPSKIVYNRDDVENEDIQQFLKAEDLIIATNIAGRGTDLRIDDAAVQNGGLFVLVTFLPLNERVEKQIFGKTARKGQTGSAQIIIDRSVLTADLATFGNISDLKSHRNKINNACLEDYHKVLTETVGNKERLFNSYCKFLQANVFSNEDSENKIYRNTMHEYWGFWLKANFTPAANIDELEKKLRRHYHDALEKTKSNDSPNSNICHIIHIANEELEKGHYLKARSLFTKAIKMDEKWSAVAYYNRAFCSFRQSCKNLSKITRDLKKAREGFEVFKEETVLCIGLIQATQCVSKDSNEPGSIMQQMQARCKILAFLDENISSALSKIKEFQVSNKELELDVISPFRIAFGDISAKIINEEMHLFWEMGLLEIINMHEKASFSWNGLAVTAIGLVQISVGAMIISSTQGLLINLGRELISEGISDVCTGINAIIMRDSTFVKSWGITKAAGIAISFATFGLNVCKSKKALKTFKQLKSEAKSILKLNVKRAAKDTFKQTCRSVAVHTSKEISQRTGRYLIDFTKTELKAIFEKKAQAEVRNHVHKAFRDGFGKIARNLIRFYLSKGEQCTDIRKLFQNMFDNMMHTANMNQIGPALCGCVKTIVMSVKKDCKEGFSKDCFQLCELFDSLKYETADLSELVNMCMIQLENILKEKQGDHLEKQSNDEFTESSSKEDSLISEIEMDTVKKIFSMITESFVKTGNTLISDQLADSLHGLAQAVTTGKRENIFASTFEIAGTLIKDYGNEDAQSVFILSKHVSEFIQGAKKEQMMSLAFDIAIDSVDVFADHKTRDTLKFRLKWAKQTQEVIQRGDTKEMISFATDMAQEAVTSFADNKTQKTLFFALRWAKRVIEALKEDGNEDLMSLAFDLMDNGIDTFSEGQTQKALFFGLRWIKQAKNAMTNGLKDQIIPFATTVAEDAIEIFVNGKTDIYKTLKFGLKWAKKAQVINTGGKENVIGLAMELTEEAVDTFSNGQTHKTLTFCLNCAKQARESVTSLNNESTSVLLLKIAFDAVDLFAEGQTHKTLIFGLKWLKEVTKYKRETNGEKKQMISLAIEISKDTIETFTCGSTQKTLKFGLKWADQAAEIALSKEKVQMLPLIFYMAEDAIKFFVNEKAERALNFALKWAKQGIEINRNDREELISLFIRVANDGVNTFADGRIKLILQFGMKWAKLGIKALKGDGKKQIISLVENIAKDAVYSFSDNHTQNVLLFGLKWANRSIEAIKFGGKKL